MLLHIIRSVSFCVVFLWRHIWWYPARLLCFYIPVAFSTTFLWIPMLVPCLLPMLIYIAISFFEDLCLNPDSLQCFYIRSVSFCIIFLWRPMMVSCSLAVLVHTRVFLHHFLWRPMLVSCSLATLLHTRIFLHHFPTKTYVGILLACYASTYPYLSASLSHEDLCWYPARLLCFYIPVSFCITFPRRPICWYPARLLCFYIPVSFCITFPWRPMLVSCSLAMLLHTRVFLHHFPMNADVGIRHASTTD